MFLVDIIYYHGILWCFCLQESSSVDKIDAINGLVAFISGPGHVVRSSLTSNFKSEIDQEMLQIIKKIKQVCVVINIR